MKKLIIMKKYLIITIFLMLLFCITSLLLTLNGTTIANAQETEKEFQNSQKEAINKIAQMNRSEVENQDYVYIDYEDGHILPNQTFVIPFVVNSEKIVIDGNKTNSYTATVTSEHNYNGVIAVVFEPIPS